MKQPISFIYRNLVFGAGEQDVWGVYRVETCSYSGMTTNEKKEVLGLLAAFAYAVERDFSVMRVARPWSGEQFTHGAFATLDERHGHEDFFSDYVRMQAAELGDRQTASAEVYLSVRLSEPAPSVGSLASSVLSGRADRSVSGIRRLLGLRDPRGISARQLERLLGEERKVFARASDYLECDRATSDQLQWLIRRSFTRGVGEPELDGNFLPQALVSMDTDDECRFHPLEHDVLRLFDTPVSRKVGDRRLRRMLYCESEAGANYQAMLVLGALPEAVAFPGPQAELLSAPLEALDFPVDATLWASFVPSEQAIPLVRRRIIDADHIYTEESHGDHGPSAQSAERPRAARELEEYLTDSSRPPLLRATIGLAFGAPDLDELERRAERLKREYAPIKLHQPSNNQFDFFSAHLPGQGVPIRDYEDYLVVEQWGAMVPTATHSVGTEAGPYIGYTLTGSAQPVMFDLTEASRTSRPPSILCAGTLGSGKTMFLQLLLYQAFLQGSRVVDVDPKGEGDHNLHLLPGVEGNVELIELSGDESYRGMLDPLRIAPAGTAEDLATSFLIDVLPAPVVPEWRTAIRAAVKLVMDKASPHDRNCTSVIAALEVEGSPEAAAASKALGVYADTGFCRLGFAHSDSLPPLAGEKQVTMLRIRSLPRPIPGTPKAELSEEERMGQAVLRLMAAYAMYLMGGDRGRHKVLGLDEAWFLLQDSAGRRLIEHLNRWGRSLNATPILATQMIADASELDSLIGARFQFGVESGDEAARGLSFLRCDPDDDRMRQRLINYRRGQCLVRDYEGRVAPVQTDLIDPRLLAALDTTPNPDVDAGEDDYDAAGNKDGNGFFDEIGEDEVAGDLVDSYD